MANGKLAEVSAKVPGVDSAEGARRLEVSAQVTDAPHEALRLTTEDLLRMQRQMLTARLIDEAALRQNNVPREPKTLTTAFDIPRDVRQIAADLKELRKLTGAT